MDAVGLPSLVLVGAAPPLVALALLAVVVVEPAGGLAVELHPASTNAATVGARVSAASLDEWSVLCARIYPRFPSVGFDGSAGYLLEPVGHAQFAAAVPDEGCTTVKKHRLVPAVGGDVVRDRVGDHGVGRA